ncbi:DUF4301 family protein [Ascidiimonas sp. W6]|uniref:DUF4301 family protein n=1 Tax=Ascidiimonas meishanensis TaxID=3128903 RepID=UPI0030EC94F3
MLTAKDHAILVTKNISESQVKRQLEIFKRGIPFISLEDSATLGNGIIKCSEVEKENYILLFESKIAELSLLKFVPASGAASRMFKVLFEFLEEFDAEKQSLSEYIKINNLESIAIFFHEIENLPFYDKVKQALQKEGLELSNIEDGRQAYSFVEKMLLSKGFDYGDFPKGLLPFHNYKEHTASAFMEHLYEAAIYCTSSQKAKLHFTISEAHVDKFRQEYEYIKKRVESDTGVSFDVSFSFQKGTTDTIAVTPENNFFRTDEGALVFRPAGHGALIENLNDQDADIIFIKNIDNVVVNHLQPEMAVYKKVLAGKLLEIQQKVFEFSKKLDATSLNSDEIEEIINFLYKDLNIRFTKNLSGVSISEKKALIYKALNRPIRVCGMVKNVGEPGGGPFWVRNSEGEVSLQIVESAQINKQDKKQHQLLQSSTHFNPVDLVCSIKNYKGEKYNLPDFVDTDQGFITEKTYLGRSLKGLELPGLWNGAMAGWNTIFIEVPLSTFNPVKTVIDLLKDAHQPKI